MTLPVITLDQIRTVATRELVFAAVRHALISHADGHTLVPPPLHLNFPAANGDCHVKAGYLTAASHFTVKVATGFYNNPRIGRPTNNGLMLVLNAATGAPATVLTDEGWLTAWRTAAGALISHALTPPEIHEAAVLGTGLQARLQIEWLRTLRPLTRIAVWGRSHDAVERLCADLQQIGIDAQPASIEQAARTGCVITTTAAPLGPAQAFATGRHITAIGTDMPGKNELPPELFSTAAIIATDDHTQCLHHGDFGNAARAGCVAADADTAIGDILRNGNGPRDGLSIADLTGIGAADAAIATAVLDALDHTATNPPASPRNTRTPVDE